MPRRWSASFAGLSYGRTPTTKRNDSSRTTLLFASNSSRTTSTCSSPCRPPAAVEAAPLPPPVAAAPATGRAGPSVPLHLARSAAAGSLPLPHARVRLEPLLADPAAPSTRRRRLRPYARPSRGSWTTSAERALDGVWWAFQRTRTFSTRSARFARRWGGRTRGGGCRSRPRASPSSRGRLRSPRRPGAARRGWRRCGSRDQGTKDQGIDLARRRPR